MSETQASERGSVCRWADRGPLPEGCEWAYVPALIDILARVEMVRGLPLSEDEVITLRDAATVIAVPEGGRDRAAAARGYPDVEPAHVWRDWQQVRQALGADPKPKLTLAQRVGTSILRLIGRR